MFIWKEGALNEEQEKAVKCDDSVLLVACPGSGKTRTLTYKIAYELSRLESNKQYIVAITYTNNAADEIKDRVELLGVNTDQLWIGTIHSFCLEWILKPYHQYLEDLKYGFRIISAYDAESLLTELCEPYSHDDPKVRYWDCGIIAKTDNYYKTCLDTSKHARIDLVHAEYFEILNRNNQIDFEQILFYSYQLLVQKPVISTLLSKIFPFILIDEYQDTKQIQYHIIAMILRENRGKSKTLIVGDPNQSIYQTLGGYPMRKIDLENLFEFNLTRMNLEKNYRSSSKIIEYYDYFKIHSSSIKPSGCFKDYPSTITYDTSVSKETVINKVAELIKFNIQKGISPDEICVVAPQWIHIASITRQLMAILPDYSFDGPGMAPFSRDIENFWFKVSRIALTEPSPYMFIRRLRWSQEVLKELDLMGVCVAATTNRDLLKFCNSIKIDENDGLKYLETFFEKLSVYLSISIYDYKTLYEHHSAFFENSKKRIERLESERSPFIRNIASFRKVFKQKDGITVSTIHGVKGEEYDTMIGFALLDGYIPHFSDPNGDENADKLLYVLASRARKNLHLISEKGRAVNWYNQDGKLPTPNLINYEYLYDEIDYERQ